MKILPFIFISLFYTYLTSAQSIQFTKEDSLYFKEQQPRYEKWLLHKGFNALLKVYELDTDTNMVTLILKSTMSDADSSHWSWKKMKNKYDAMHTDFLEACLIQRFCRLMEIPEDMAVIEIYNNIGDFKPCFYREIYYNKGELVIDSAYCMNKSSEIYLEDYELRPNIKIKSSQITGASSDKMSRRHLEIELQHFIKEYFINENKGKLEFYNRPGSLLFFEVTEIRRLVLTDEANPALAELLNFFGLDVDWVKREFLTIEIKHEFDKDGLKIIVDINGKYGSGFHQPRRNAYIEMEPEFEDYLARFAEKLASKIRLYLIK